MNLKLFLLGCALIGLAMFSHPAEYRVLDGDTIQSRSTGERIRLVGFDAPELFHAACGREHDLALIARDRLIDLLRGGTVSVERIGLDRYGRTLARVRVDGVDVADEMIRRRLAVPYSGGPRDPTQWCRRMEWRAPAIPRNLGTAELTRLSRQPMS